MELFPVPAQLTVQRIRSCAALLVLLVAGAIFLPARAGVLWGLFCIVLSAVLCLVYFPMMQRSFSYNILPESVHVKSGILKKRFSHTPVSGIQYISLTQSPLERIFGTVCLRLHLAGGSVCLWGLSRPVAEQTAQTIMPHRPKEDSPWKP